MNGLNLAKTIEPKSDQLNADDLVTGPLTVTVLEVKRGPGKDQPVEIVVDGHRPYRPCKSMRRVLIACWGDQGSEWIGKSMTLYSDPSVKFGGVAVGGIRISHLSGLDSEKSMMLTTTRARRAEYIVKPLTETPASYPQDAFDTNVGAWAKAVLDGKFTVPQIISKAQTTGRLTNKQIKALEAEVKKMELNDANNQGAME